MTFRASSFSDNRHHAYIIRPPGKKKGIVYVLWWRVIAIYEFLVLVDTEWGKIMLPRGMHYYSASITPLTAAVELDLLDRKTRNSVRSSVGVTQQGNDVFSADLTVIRSVTSGTQKKKAETLIFLEHSLDSPDGMSSAAYLVLQRVLEAQLILREHSLDPACSRLPDPGSVLRPRGTWAGTRHLARLVLEHYSADEMGEANYERVRALLQDEGDLSA